MSAVWKSILQVRSFVAAYETTYDNVIWRTFFIIFHSENNENGKTLKEVGWMEVLIYDENVGRFPFCGA